jgi:hypothetical protein
VAAIVIVLAAAPLIPAMPYSMERIYTPRYFSSSDASAIAPGSVALTYPPPTPFTSVTMMWQASAGLRFRMVGVYMYAQDGHGVFTTSPNHSFTEVMLYDIWAGKPTSATTQAVVRNIRRDLATWRVSTVLVATRAPHSNAAVSLFTKLFGRAPAYRDDEAVWYGLPFASARAL